MAARKIDGWWHADFRSKGERYRKRSPQNTSAGARAYENFLRGELAKMGSLDHLDPAKQPQEKQIPTFAEYANDWLVTYVRTKNRASERRTKESILQRHLIPHFGAQRLTEIHRRDVECYKAMKHEELAGKSINNHLTILRKCLWTAQKDDHIPSLPLIEWCEEDPPGFDFLMPIESHQLLQDQTEPFWTDLARLALRTGMRRGELMALEWSEINLASARLTVCRSLVEGVLEMPKTNRIRHLPLTEDVVAMLAERRRQGKLVFAHPDGRPLSKRNMALGLTHLCQRAGVRHLGWHVLRHTYASQLAMEGVPLLTISRLMGHSTTKMTERYAHLAPSHLADTVPALLRAEKRALATCGQPVGSDAQITSAMPVYAHCF